MNATTTNFMASPPDVPTPTAEQVTPSPRAPKNAMRAAAPVRPFLRYAAPVARLLNILSGVWVVSVLTYAVVVVRAATAVPAYAYVLVAILMVVPALTMSALSLAVNFMAQVLAMLPALSARVQQAEQASSEVTNTHYALTQAITSQLEETEQRTTALAASLASLCSDYDTRLTNLRRDVSLRSLATQVPPVHAPFIPSTPAVATSAEMTENAPDDAAAHSAQPLSAETEMENLILRHERHLFDGLHALSIELVRLTDAAASPDLWRRYMRGERDVFTADFAQRLSYGNNTAENYRSKDEFRRAVVRYIAQYETLRERLSRLDDANAVHDYLEHSAAGRVYGTLMQATSDYARAED